VKWVVREKRDGKDFRYEFRQYETAKKLEELLVSNGGVALCLRQAH